MAALTVQKIDYTGTVPTFSTPTTSDTAAVSSRRFLVYKNTNAATRTVTLTVPTTTTPYTETNPNVTYTLGATTGELWIPLHPDYADASGNVTITLSSTTNVTAALVDAGWSI